jgi:hypothetical protein
VHHHVPPTKRLVRDAARVATVDAARATTAGRTWGCLQDPTGFDMDDIIKHERALDLETGQVGKEIGNAQVTTSKADASS